MTDHIITLANGDELRVFTEPSLQGRRAYSLLFSSDSDILAETESTQYIDYCESCIVLRESAKVAADVEHVWSVLESLGHVCTCD